MYQKNRYSVKNQACYFSTNLGDMKDCKSFSNEIFYTYRYHHSVNCFKSKNLRNQEISNSL